MVSRVRYVVTRNNRKELFCGLARSFTFKPVDEIGDTAIKTYSTYNKAKSSFLSSWYGATEEDFENGTYEIVKVVESIKEGE